MTFSHRDNGLPSRPTASLGRLVRLVRKELSEVLRDRRTIITLVFMPLLLYPLLAIAFQQVAAATLLDAARTLKGPKKAGAEPKPEFRIGVLSDQEENTVRRIFENGEKYYGEFLARRPESELGISTEWVLVNLTAKDDAERGLPPPPPLERDEARKLLQTEIEKDTIDAGIIVDGVLPVSGQSWHLWSQNAALIAGVLPYVAAPLGTSNRIVHVEVVSMPEKAGSQKTADLINRRLLWFHQRMVVHRLGGFDPRRPIALVEIEHTALKLPGGSVGISLPALVPLILILMTITGAVYPAIDSTAGERERGTLEMLVAAPVPRLGLLFAKYVTVVVVAVLTGVVNLIGMTVTLKFSGLEDQVVPGGLSLAVLAQVVGLLTLFALFFSALLLSITSFARSFKEAQAYLIPLMLVSLAPGIIGVLPGFKLQGILIVAPLVNIVLLGRDLFQGETDLGTAVLVVGVTLTYAGAAIALAARVFGAESVLYSEQSGWSDLFRRPEEPRETASVPAAIWCLAVMIPIHYVAQGSLALLGLDAPWFQIGTVIFLSLLLFAALPALAAWLGRVRLETGFALRWPGVTGLLAGLVMGFALWPGVLWVLSQIVDPSSIPQEATNQMRALRILIPFGLLVAVVIAAIVEELFFRGFLFSALEKTAPAWATILLTTLLFGILHVVTGGPLGTMRFWPSIGMGLILGLVRWSTGSVLPGLILHALHNGMMEIAAGRGWELQTTWILASPVALVVGFGLIALGSRVERKRVLVR